MIIRKRPFGHRVFMACSPFLEEIKVLALLILYVIYQTHASLHELAPGENKVILFRLFDVTNWAHDFALRLTNFYYAIARHLPGLTDLEQYGNTLFTAQSPLRLSIEYGCLAIRQHNIFTVMLLIAGGPWLKKLLYIFWGNIFLILVNVGRIITLLYIAKFYPQRFVPFHDDYLRYIHFGIVFLLWLAWVYHFKAKAVASEKGVQIG